MKAACGPRPSASSIPARASARCSNLRCCAHASDQEARVAPHQSQLAKLREALRSTVPVDDPAARSLEVEQTLNKLQEKWRQSDEDEAVDMATAREPSGYAKGVRRVGDAMEYDFSLYREPGDEDDDADDRADTPNNGPNIPREMRYFDTASINIKAGNGGAGCCAFRREKFVDHGGPSGGNGGDGGSIWAVADEGMSGLGPFRNTVHFKAQDGTSGQGKDMHGANAKDTFVKVPMGTIIRRKDDDESSKPLAELLCHGAPLRSCICLRDLRAPSCGPSCAVALCMHACVCAHSMYV